MVTKQKVGWDERQRIPTANTPRQPEIPEIAGGAT
jgi:hypothetical protein